MVAVSINRVEVDDQAWEKLKALPESARRAYLSQALKKPLEEFANDQALQRYYSDRRNFVH
jgi:hypothetical protein